MIITIKRITTFFLVLLFAAVFAFPTLAGSRGVTPMGVSGIDEEKLLAFWQQPAYNGLNNGEAVYDHDWPSQLSYEPSYSGYWYTELVNLNTPYGGFALDFDYYIEYYFEDDSDPNFPPISVIGLEFVYPDLYGSLDMDSTHLVYLNTPGVGQTHITSVSMDDCPKLRGVTFNDQTFCTSISALGDNKLEAFTAKNCAYRNIAFKPEEFSDSIISRAIGYGTIGAEYDYNSGNTAKLYAYSQTGRFFGWYSNGQLVTSELLNTCADGGSFVACFGGDVDFDNHITAADSLLIMRQALGLTTLPVYFEDMDVNCSGAVDAGDALLVLRLTLGLE